MSRSHRPMVDIPRELPLFMQDIDLMRCTVCGAVMSGTWGISRELSQPAIDHLLDRHAVDLVVGQVRRPLIVNCAIQDPFWFEEHTT